MATDLFQAPDYYNMDDLLNEEHKMVRDAARDWVKKCISPIIENACETLCYYPRRSRSMEKFDCYGGMNHFQETFRSRIEAWVQDNIKQVSPTEVNGSGKEGLAAQEAIEGAIRSFETDTVVKL